MNITSVKLQHNHEISKTAFESYTVSLNEEEKEVALNLHEANCKVSQIARVLRVKFDKKSTKKVRNLIQKLAPTSLDGDTKNFKFFWNELKRKEV